MRRNRISSKESLPETSFEDSFLIEDAIRSYKEDVHKDGIKLWGRGDVECGNPSDIYPLAIFWVYLDFCQMHHRREYGKLDYFLSLRGFECNSSYDLRIKAQTKKMMKISWMSPNHPSSWPWSPPRRPAWIRSIHNFIHHWHANIRNAGILNVNCYYSYIMFVFICIILITSVNQLTPLSPSWAHFWN